MEIHKVPINTLTSPDWNPRQITEEELTKLETSLKEFGYIEPIIVNDVNNHIVGGNQRCKALKTLGYEEVDVVYVHIEDIHKEKACNVALNKISGDWDNDKLRVVLEEIELSPIDVSLTGFDEIELTEMEITTNEPVEVVEDDYEEPDDLEVTVNHGDVYQLGKHRLMCGDSTKNEDVEQLMNNQIADISFQSPPYNVGASPTYEQRILKKESKYENNNDNLNTDDYTKFLIDFTKNSLKYSQYTFCNIQSLSNNKDSLIDYMYHMKKEYADTIIWDKQNSQPAMPQNVMNAEFEYIHIFSNKGNRNIGTIPFRGNIPNIIHISRGHNDYSKVHNAVFPIQLPSYIIEKFADKTVLDLFGGTGTTLIACEQLNRECYMMEYEPLYCQIIIDRWETYTGEKATKIN